MEEAKIIDLDTGEEVDSFIPTEDQEIETCEDNSNAALLVFGAACVGAGIVLTKVGEVVIPKVVSGAKKVGRGFKNLFTKKDPDNVVDGDFEVVEDEVFEDDEKAN